MHTHTPTHYLILLVIGDRDKWGRGGGVPLWLPWQLSSFITAPHMNVVHRPPHHSGSCCNNRILLGN